MDEKFAAVGKEVLVEMVRLAQKEGREGGQGSWKEFLTVHDKKFGKSISDPARRTTDVLVTFLKTFTEEDDLKIFEKIMQSHSNRDAVRQFCKNSADAESPEQRLVRLTLEHPHFLRDYLFPSHEEEWLVTKLHKKSKAMKSTEMVAVDCEMVLCKDGTEAVVRVCVVDRTLQVKLNTLVNPNKEVEDYRSEITGITAKDLDGVTCSLADVQKSMKKILSHGTILIGHSLNNDLRALKIDHPRVIDTTFIFKYGSENNYRSPSLNNLCKSVLGFVVREPGAPHNCVDDASAAMKLVLAKLERGLDDIIPSAPPKLVPESEMVKLFIHNIPVDVPMEELRNFIPRGFTFEIEGRSKKPGAKKYNVFAIFKNKQEATRAFNSISGDLEKDNNGLPQKLVPFELKTGLSGSVYVRKMAHDNPLGQASSKKRSSSGVAEMSAEPKKLKTGHHSDGETSEEEEEEEETKGDDDDSVFEEEIERLNKELRKRDEEISSLNKIIAALARKQGL